VVEQVPSSYSKKGGSLQKDPDIVRRQTDERHKAMLGIFTAVSKLK
jgi:hypothetical protein